MYFRGWVLHLNGTERQKRLRVESDKSWIPSRDTVDGKCHQAPWVCASLRESCTFTKQWRKQQSVFSAWIIRTFTISISHLFFIVYFAGVLGFCLIFSFLCSLQSQFLPQYCQKLINVHTYSYSHVCSRYFWCEWVFKWECICVCILCVVACKVFCQLFQNLRDFLPVQWDS